MKTKYWHALSKGLWLASVGLLAIAVMLSSSIAASALRLDAASSNKSGNSTTASHMAYALSGPTLSVSMSVVTPQPVLSGNPVTWEISWECSSVEATPCTGARIDVTKPALTGNGSAVGSPGFTTSAFTDGTGAHYVFIDPLPAGSSGTLQLLWESVNLHTPDGTVLTPVATFSATNANSFQASTGAEVEAAMHLAITKQRGCSFCVSPPTDEPPLDVDVTYAINVFDSSWPNFSSPLPGTWTVVNAIVKDTLPPGSLFVSATGGGIYDTATHTVTWPAIPEVAAYEYFGFKFYVTIRYPSLSFTSDNDPANPSDNITNQVMVVGKPYGQPDGSDVSGEASVRHGFLNQAVVSGAFGKVSYPTGTRGGGEISAFELTWQNPSSVPASFTATDRLPCQVTSPTGPLVLCTNPGIRITKFWLRSPVMSGAVVISYTTNLGNVGIISLTAPVQYKSPGVDDDVPRTFSPGEYVSHLTVTGSLAGGFDQTLVMDGTVAPDFPDDPLTETDFMTNCADGSLDFGAFGTLGPFHRCFSLPVVSPKPVILHFKGGTSLGAIAPTEARTFSLSANPCYTGDLPWHPLVTDLLPANLRYVPGTQTANTVDGVLATFEVIDNYHGSGRQLLRWSWPGGQALNSHPCGGGFESTFQAQVEPGTIPGTYTNYAQFFDAAFTNNNTSLTNICVYGLEPDAEDLDGDGNTTEYRCVSSADYTVVETASMVVTKEVRGSFDTSFKAPPGIGLVDPGNPAEYRITLQNTGNLSLSNLVGYDILPFIGDSGVSGTQLGVPRGSQWQPILAGAVIPPAGGTVEYSMSTNPCRGEVITQGGTLAAGPSGCVNDWTASPASFSAVRAIRINLGSTVLAGGESRSVVVPMTSPLGVEGIAWNTVALAGQNNNTSAWLLPTEPPKVGLAVPIDLELDKTVSPTTSVLPGATLTYGLTITNKGPGSATGVEVKDVLPAGLTFQSATPAASYDSGTGIWTIGSLAIHESASLTITATVNSGTEGTTITNFTQVNATNEVDLDSTPGNNAGPTPSEDDEDAINTQVVNKATPSLTTTPDPSSGTIGVMLKDSAALTGGFSPTGNITFNLYAPSDPTCAGAPAFMDAAPVHGNGAYSTSSGFASNASGIWHWTATYSGDSNNTSVSSGCNAEPVTVTQAVQSQITPTETTCSQFASGTAATLNELLYTAKSGKIGSVSPGVFFYWVKVTVASLGSKTFTINQAITTGNFDSHFFNHTSGSFAYTSGCTKVNTSINTLSGVTTVTYNASAPGTYIIGIKYDSKSIQDFNAPSPTTVRYDFSTSGVSGSTQGLNVKKKP